MEQLIFLFVLTVTCAPVAWLVMWWLATKHNRNYIRYLVEQLTGGTDGEKEKDESSKV